MRDQPSTLWNIKAPKKDLPYASEFIPQDLEVAKRRLRTTSQNLVFVKNGKVLFETGHEGLGGFVEAMKQLGIELRCSSVADTVVGKAVALLSVYSQVTAVYAVTMSRDAAATLKTHGIHCEFEEAVPAILNPAKTERCFFEKLVGDISSPKEAYVLITEACERLAVEHT